jgi:hypothetical protein
MSLRLIGIVLISVLGFAQVPTAAPDAGDPWRKIKSALMAPDGDKFFQQIFSADQGRGNPGHVSWQGGLPAVAEDTRCERR